MCCCKVVHKVKRFQPIKAVPAATPLEVHFPTCKSYSNHVEGSKLKSKEVKKWLISSSREK
jgi:hypothetical protein